MVVLDRAAVEDRQVGALPGGEDHVVRVERQQAGRIELRIELPVRIVRPLAELEGDQAVLVDAQRTPTGVQLHALADSVLDLVRAGGHVAASLERDHVDVTGALPERRQGNVDGDVAAADDDDARSDQRLAAAHVAQEVDAAEHEGLLDAVDRDESRPLRPETQEDRVVVLPERLQPGDRAPVWIGTPSTRICSSSCSSRSGGSR